MNSTAYDRNFSLLDKAPPSSSLRIQQQLLHPPLPCLRPPFRLQHLWPEALLLLPSVLVQVLIQGSIMTRTISVIGTVAIAKCATAREREINGKGNGILTVTDLIGNAT